VRSEVGKWDSYNTELITRYFSDRSKADEYGWFYASSQRIVTPWNPITTQEEVARLHTTLDTKLQRAEVLREQLPLIPECADVPRHAPFQPAPARLRTTVFLVHGRAEGARETVARFLERLRHQ
jgi:hypothetical protein